MESCRLAPDDLCWRCDPAVFEFASTADLSGLDEPIVQERALTAIDLFRRPRPRSAAPGEFVGKLAPFGCGH